MAAEALTPGAGTKRELDDSGCVQDECSPSKKNCLPTHQHSLLDFSDDVLLYILAYCEPRDLKALGYTCPRLASLIHDRSLWRVVRERRATSVARLRWLVAHGLRDHTARLELVGYAREAEHCLGFEDRSKRWNPEWLPPNCFSTPLEGSNIPGNPTAYCTTYRMDLDDLWRKFGNEQQTEESEADRAQAAACPGPRDTVTTSLLEHIKQRCPRLTHLSLEYCNFDYSRMKFSSLPGSLTHLSLRGSRVYNLPRAVDNFLSRVSEYLPLLQELDVSSCSWLEGSSMLSLSKLARLRVLRARSCPRLSEFVAYASLAARYGFKALQVLDVRDSLLGDSEVSAFGWLPLLEELYVSPAKQQQKQMSCHCHYPGEPLAPSQELDDWETQEPPYLAAPAPASPPSSPPAPAAPPAPPALFSVITVHVRPPRQRHEDMARRLINAMLDNEENGEDARPPEIPEPRPVDQRPDDEEPPPNEGPSIAGPAARPITDDSGERTFSTKRSAGDIENGVPSKKICAESLSNSANGEQCSMFDSLGEQSSSTSEQHIPGTSTSEQSNINGDQSKARKIEQSQDRTSSSEQHIPGTSIGEQPNMNGAECKAGPSTSEKHMPGTSTGEQFNMNGAKSKAGSSTSAQHMPGTSTDEQSNTNGDNSIAGPSTSTGEQSNINGDVSKAGTSTDEQQPGPSRDQPNQPNQVRYVKFRRNQPPEVIVQDNARPQPRAEVIDHPPDRQVGLYQARPSPRPIPHIEPYALVTDVTIFRYGRIVDSDIVVCQVRPNKSKLKRLVCTDYDGITDSSLMHLAVAAPDLVYVDFRGTKVTNRVVDIFKGVRPDCEVLYGKRDLSEDLG